MVHPRPSAVCAALALCALVGGPAAAARPHVSTPHRTVVEQRVNGAAAADGAHLVAWGNDAGALHVLDDSSGFATDIDLGRQCRSVLALDASHGDFLVSCRISVATGVETQQLVVEAATGELTDLVDTGYSRIGRYWVAGTVEVAGHDDVIYTNWRTGERRLFRAPR